MVMSSVTNDRLVEVLRTIPDPEMPISIVDLGIVDVVDVSDDNEVMINLLPTFVGCPALDMIRDEVIEKVGAMEGVAGVRVEYVFDPPWTVDRISEAGRESLREHGVTVPTPGLVELRVSGAVPCPFCQSRSTRLDSPFGPTRCRTIYYCDGCRNSFEHMRSIGRAAD